MGAHLNLGPPAPSLADLLNSGYENEVRYLDWARRDAVEHFRASGVLKDMLAEASDGRSFTVVEMAERIGTTRGKLSGQVSHMAKRGVFKKIGEVKNSQGQKAYLYRLADG